MERMVGERNMERKVGEGNMKIRKVEERNM